MSITLLIPGLGFGELIVFLILLLIGVVIIMILATALHFILPIIAAVVVWFLTSSLLDAGIAFLAVAIIPLISEARKVNRPSSRLDRSATK